MWPANLVHLRGSKYCSELLLRHFANVLCFCIEKLNYFLSSVAQILLKFRFFFKVLKNLKKKNILKNWKFLNPYESFWIEITKIWKKSKIRFFLENVVFFNFETAGSAFSKNLIMSLYRHQKQNGFWIMLIGWSVLSKLHDHFLRPLNQMFFLIIFHSSRLIHTVDK